MVGIPFCSQRSAPTLMAQKSADLLNRVFARQRAALAILACKSGTCSVLSGMLTATSLSSYPTQDRRCHFLMLHGLSHKNVLAEIGGPYKLASRVARHQNVDNRTCSRVLTASAELGSNLDPVIHLIPSIRCRTLPQPRRRVN